MPLEFITGPVRSGKSRFAEQCARETRGDVVYVATAAIDADDRQWQRRIERHVAHRPPSWKLVETARAGAPPLASILREATAQQTLLIDSLGTWLAHQMSVRFDGGGEAAACDEDGLQAEIDGVVTAARRCVGRAIVVGEEVGWGLVPEYPSGRVFRDVMGRAHQDLARAAARAYLVVAGYAIDLKAAREVDFGFR